MTRIIEVVVYDQNWPRLFDEEAMKVKQALGNNCIEIHHIGSTSVPGLAAKPVIDMIPVVKDILEVNTQALEDLGYIARGEFGMPFRRFFHKGEPERSHHLHIWEEGNPEIEKHLMFRDYLIAHPGEAKRYEKLKQELAEQHSHDRFAYTSAKHDLIQDMIKKSGFEGLTLLQPLLKSQWEAYHRIRKTQIFDPIDVVYDPKHPTIPAENHFHFIFLKGTEIVGTAQVELLDQHRAALRPFCIDAPYQNQGLGKKLLSLVERWVLHQGRRQIHLHANPRAVLFYRRAGYKEMQFNDPRPAPAVNIKTIDMGKVL